MMIEPKTSTPIPELHPVQRPHGHPGKPLLVSKEIALAAYEVYCHCYGEQDALITGGCRGGLGVNEAIAFLYAKSFPVNEWKTRVKEAFAGMQNF
jgi:hypothetical protein